MNRAEIYRRAAVRMEASKDFYSCWAIAKTIKPAGETLNHAEVRAYCKAFASDGEHLWAADAAEEWGENGRVLALCFAAAMAETGDL